MNKEEFLYALNRKLFGLPPSEIEERLTFYSEMIDDRMEEGLSEEEAVAAIGSVDDIARQIIEEIPLSRIMRNTAVPRQGLKVWHIVLLILGAPIWLPLLVAAFAVVLTVYVVLWVLVVCMFIVALCLIVATVCSVPAAVLYATSGSISGAVFSIGAGLICAGLTILIIAVSVLAAKGVAKLAPKVINGIKPVFIGKERSV
ncbi:MAG: DUF1700 domain-containing protein [Oscillospiraceae bacterium]|nr:DUF1700 domain-containing protein [Oscillospiraceae bacterium]